jgi:hypothetical protein
MRKLSFLSLVLIGFMLMTGCKKETLPPTLTLSSEPNITEGMEVETGTDIKFNFDCKGENLSSLLITITGENGEEIIYNFLDLNGVTSVTKTEECIFTYVGRLTLEATLRANRQTATVTLHFTSVAPSEPDPDPDPDPALFDGFYSGFLKIDGSVSALALSFPVNDSTQAEMTITTLEDNQVTAVFVYQGTSFDITGSYEDNSIVFDSFPLEISNSNLQLTATIQLNGTLDENVLSLEGNFSDCLLNYTGIQIPVEFTGEIGGVLEKCDDL